MALESLKKYAAKRTPEYNVVHVGSEVITYTHVSTGSFTLDLALLGGYPENCAITLVGKQHSGKTTMAYKAIANFQQKYDGSSESRPKRYCVFIDVERGFNAAWAAANGVNVDELTVIVPTNAEEAVDFCEAALDDPECCLVVFDSIPALVGSKELSKSAEDANAPGTVAVHANRMFRKISSVIAKSFNDGDHKTIISINQWRDGIGSAPNMPRTMPGGKYARHYAAVEIEIYNSDRDRVFATDDDGVKIAVENLHSFKIHKNRVGNSILEGEFKMSRDPANAGYIDDNYTVTIYAKKFGFIGGAGQGWWIADPETGEELEKFKSQTLVIEHVAANPEYKAKLVRAIITAQRKKQGMTVDDWW